MATKKSSSSKSKSSSKGTSQSFAPGVVNDKTTLSVRSIENGFIVSESGYRGKGRNQEYVNKEYFSKTNPVKIGGAAPSTSGVKFGKR